MDSGTSLDTSASETGTYSTNAASTSFPRNNGNSIPLSAPKPHPHPHQPKPPLAAPTSTVAVPPVSRSDSHGGAPKPLNPALHPIYFLFVAPPSAASIAWASIAGEFDMLARSLYFIAMFLYMFLALGNSNFLRTASFSLAWWAYTFPCEYNICNIYILPDTRF